MKNEKQVTTRLSLLKIFVENNLIGQKPMQT